MLSLVEIWNTTKGDNIQRISRELFEHFRHNKNKHSITFDIILGSEVYEITAKWSYRPLYCKIRNKRDDTVQIFRNPTNAVKEVDAFVANSIFEELLSKHIFSFNRKED